MHPHLDSQPFAKIIQIGDLRFGETTTPICPGVNDVPASHPLPRFTLPVTIVRLEQAHAMLPFTFSIPAWLPDGFAFDPEVSMTLPPQELSDDTGTIRLGMTSLRMASVYLMWQHADGRYIGLNIRSMPADRPASDEPIPIVPGGVDALEVHQHPAALIRQQYEWSPDDKSMHISDSITLRWRENNHEYDLRTQMGHVSTDDLLRIANAINV